MSYHDKHAETLTSIQHLIVDMDGVLYRGGQRLPGARRFLRYLAQNQVPFVLATNNSTLTPQQYVRKLASMDIEVSEERIITSALAAALYLERVAGRGARVYPIGEDGLLSALSDRGFLLTHQGVEYVVVGLDRRLTWEKLSTAALAIRAGAAFIGTNPDTTLPTEEGLVPGNGAILAALETATQVPPVVIGKPQPTLLELAMQQLGVSSEGTAMVGDRLETDILGGKNAGVTTVLVLSGISHREELEASDYLPDLVFDNIGDFHRAWREAREG
jgi:4-nitrophenyl phosphatase